MFAALHPGDGMSMLTPLNPTERSMAFSTAPDLTLSVLNPTESMAFLMAPDLTLNPKKSMAAMILAPDPTDGIPMSTALNPTESVAVFLTVPDPTLSFLNPTKSMANLAPGPTQRPPMLAALDPTKSVPMLTALNPTRRMASLTAPDLTLSVLNSTKRMILRAPDPTA